MMKTIYAIISIALLAALAESLMPWWVIAPVAFTVTYFFQLRGWRAFLTGMLGIGLLWIGLSAYIDHTNTHILSARVATLFYLTEPIWLIVITGLIGGLVGGISALAASYLVTEHKVNSL
jgi:hypothetical protein